MRTSIRLGRFFGIPVGLSWSVLLIAGLLTLSLGTALLPDSAPGASDAAYFFAAAVAAVLFFGSLLAHELAHAVVARRNGVEVEGITLWLLGGVARLGSEARSAGAELRIAAVGPGMSFALAVGFGVAAIAADTLLLPALAVAVLGWLALINAALAVFNLLPAAPLDGGRILTGVLWAGHGDPYRARETAARAGRVVGFGLIAFGVLGLLTPIPFGGPWTALVGWFIVTTAAAEERLARRRRAIRTALLVQPSYGDGSRPNQVTRPGGGVPL
ncbi:MAG: site-2 protease family protein [Acidimicrobiia bacterium]